LPTGGSHTGKVCSEEGSLWRHTVLVRMLVPKLCLVLHYPICPPGQVNTLFTVNYSIFVTLNFRFFIGCQTDKKNHHWENQEKKERSKNQLLLCQAAQLNRLCTRTCVQRSKVSVQWHSITITLYNKQKSSACN